MARSFIQLYALAVCFATLMCLVIALGLGLYDLIRVAAPGFTVQDYGMWQSDEQLLLYYPDKKDMQFAERTAFRENQRAAAVSSERRSALQRLVFVAIILGIDMVVYALHWRIARRMELLPREVSKVAAP
jgi:hypothetical protein